VLFPVDSRLQLRDNGNMISWGSILRPTSAFLPRNRHAIAVLLMGVLLWGAASGEEAKDWGISYSLREVSVFPDPAVRQVREWSSYSVRNGMLCVGNEKAAWVYEIATGKLISTAHVESKDSQFVIGWPLLLCRPGAIDLVDWRTGKTTGTIPREYVEGTVVCEAFGLQIFDAGSHIIAYDERTGSKAWDTDCGFTFDRNLSRKDMCNDNDVLYFASAHSRWLLHDNVKACAVSLKDGSLLWSCSFEPPNDHDVGAFGLNASGDFLGFNDAFGFVFLSLKDGKEVWRTQTRQRMLWYGTMSTAPLANVTSSAGFLYVTRVDPSAHTVDSVKVDYCQQPLFLVDNRVVVSKAGGTAVISVDSVPPKLVGESGHELHALFRGNDFDAVCFHCDGYLFLGDMRSGVFRVFEAKEIRN